MNTCVSDDFNIVNVQGIRYVKWGETNTAYLGRTDPYHVEVHYKGTNNVFYYKEEAKARSFFNKIREAMDKTAEKVK